MRLTAKEYAHRFGLNPRTVRLKLASGDLPGFKGTDPITGSPTWFVEVPDGQVDQVEPEPGEADPAPWITPADQPDLPPGRNQPIPQVEHANQEDLPSGSGWIAFEQHQSIVDRYHRENLELAGRLGWMSKELETTRLQLTEAHQKIALLEAPQPAESERQEPERKPWWRFW